MDTRAGIQKAFQDYSMGVNGFEGAHEWKSEIGKRVRPYITGWFALLLAAY